MSKEMNNEHNKASEQELEKKLNKAFNDTSNETTSSQLDASIMAMAQQEVEARDSGKAKKSWWDRLKMPVSLTAALVVTVGIARFMVELGYYSPNSISDSENLVQASEYKDAPQESMVVLSDDSYLLEGTQLEGTQLKDTASAPLAAKPAPRVMAEERTAARQQSDNQAAERERVVVTGARLKREELETARQREAKERQALAKQQSSAIVAEPSYKKEHEQLQTVKAEADVSAESVDGTVERIVVTGSRLKRSDVESAESDSKADANHNDAEDNLARIEDMERSEYSGQREATETPYLPAEEWLQQISTLLGDDKAKEAKEQWMKFKQVYPDYSVEKSLYQRLESL